MKLKKLLLNNFGIYAGIQEIDFSVTSCERPIILIGGYNGRGKTSILEAILLCLYGKRSYALSESKMTYAKYLNKYVNRNNNNRETVIEVTMSVEIDTIDADILVRREWVDKEKDVTEIHRVFLNGIFDEYLTDDWDNQMDFIMPIGMSRFFLFDGEKVSELVDSFSEERLKQAIKTLLGIDIIERLDDDLSTIIGKNRIAKEIEANDNEVKILQEKKNELQGGISACKKVISQLVETIEKSNNQLYELEKQFLSSGGAIFDKKEITLQKRGTIEKKLRIIQSEIHEKLAGSAPLVLTMQLLNEANDTAKIERDCEILNYEIYGVEKLLEGFDIPAELNARYNKMKDNHHRLQTTIIDRSLSLSPAGTDLLNKLCTGIPFEELERLQELLVRKNELQEQLNNYDNYLAVEVSTKKLGKLVEDMKTLNRDISKNQILLDKVENDLADRAQSLAAVTASLDRLTAQLLSQYESNDNSVRLVRYSIMAKDVLGHYSNRIKKMKTEILSAKIMEKFRTIIGKRKLIERIDFNPDDLSMELYDENGKIYNRKQLSAGEQQLLSTAIVWGIVECTGQEFPMIIDTPLARLDSSHREQFVDNYIPNAGKQIIVFSTDAEIIGELEERIDEYIARKYLLHYDESTRSTFVKEGYFE